VSVTPTPRASFRYRSLDLWRGVACLSVAAFHSSLYLTRGDGPGQVAGWQRLVVALLGTLSAGVPLFFVISGYCISASCDKVRRGNAPLWSSYYFRRLRRIFPPFWAMFFITVVLAVTLEAIWPGIYADNNNPIDHPALLAPVQWVANLTLTEGLRPNFGPPEQNWLARHSWTLAYEEQFYLMMGLLLFISRTRFFRNALIATTLILGTELALKASGLDSIPGLFFNRWAFFAAGMLVYWSLHHATPRQRKLGTAVLAAALLGLALPLPVLERWNMRTLESVTAFAFALVLMGVHRYDARLVEAARHGALKALNWCGYRCYSIYLLHWPLVKLTSHGAYMLGVRGFWPTLLVTLPVSIATAVAGGGIFHHLVERHFLNPAMAPAVPTLAPELAAEAAGPRAGLA